MASSSVACITSALEDLHLLKNICPLYGEDLDIVEHSLRFLRTFVLCARKWDKDDVRIASDAKKNEVDSHHASLQALVVRIEDIISKKAQEIIHSIHLDNLENRISNQVFHVMDDAKEDIISLRQEIYEQYVFLSDCFSKQSSTNLLVGKDDIMEFMDSLVENLVYFYHWEVELQVAQDPCEVYLVESLGEKLAFLKNFIHFVTLHGDEDAQLEPLLTHIKAVAINATCLSYRCKFMKKCELKDETHKSISELLLKIIPVEPLLQESCVQALIASNYQD